MNKLKEFIRLCEEANIGFGLWITTALCIIFIRDSLESLASIHSFPPITPFHFLHVPVFFLTLLLSVIILLHFFSREDIVKVSRVSLIFFSIIIFPVCLDLLLYLTIKKEVTYEYITGNLWQNFINFFNPFFKIPEVPYSLRLEGVIISGFSFIYIFLKNGKVFLSLLGGYLVSALCFWYGALPGLMVNAFIGLVTFLFRLFHSVTAGRQVSGIVDENVVVIAELVFGVFVLAVWLWIYDARKFKALLKNLRYSRALHYFILLGIGLALYFYQVKETDAFIVIKVIAMFLALFFAGMFSVVANDIFDIECDKLSNNTRPLISGILSKPEYLKIGAVFLALSLLFSFWVSAACFAINLLFIVIYFLYSSPPFRLKRNFLFSSFVIGLQACVAVLLGQLSLSTEGVAPALNIPILSLVFLAFSLSSNIKDLKDRQGDQHCGVFSLPVIFGAKTARKIIALLVCSSYLAVPLFLYRFFYDFKIIILSFLFGLINYFYIRREDSSERPVFLMYFIYVFLMVFFARMIID